METMTKAARLEVRILETLQHKRTAVGDKNCIRLITDFTYRGHTCLVFEPMVRCWRQPGSADLQYSLPRQACVCMLGHSRVWCCLADVGHGALPLCLLMSPTWMPASLCPAIFVKDRLLRTGASLCCLQASILVYSTASSPGNSLACMVPCVTGHLGPPLHAQSTCHSQRRLCRHSTCAS